MTVTSLTCTLPDPENAFTPVTSKLTTANFQLVSRYTKSECTQAFHCGTFCFNTAAFLCFLVSFSSRYVWSYNTSLTIGACEKQTLPAKRLLFVMVSVMMSDVGNCVISLEHTSECNKILSQRILGNSKKAKNGLLSLNTKMCSK